MALAKAELEQPIRDRIRSFDAVALLLLLAELGYDPAKIHYCANYTASPQPTLLDSIDFNDPSTGNAALLSAPRRPPATMIDLLRMDRGGRPDEVEVTVTVNLGLLSNRSPLPTYFEELLDDPAYQEPLSALIDLLDDKLIRDRLASFRPETAPGFLPDWDWVETKHDWLRLTSVGTPCTLHWMFQQIFPELEVSVRRVPIRRAMPAPGVRLGDPQSRVGVATFGGEADVTVYGLEVTLIAAEAVDDTGDPWPGEALKRTQAQALPVLGEAAVNLTVVLVSQERPRDLGIDDGTRLGESPLYGEAPGAGPPWRVVIWSGVAPEGGGGTAQDR